MLMLKMLNLVGNDLEVTHSLRLSGVIRLAKPLINSKILNKQILGLFI